MQFENELSIAKVILVGMIVSLLLVAIIVLFLIHYQKRLLQKQIEIQNIESQYQKKLLKTSLQAQENERKRIARDLHDDVGVMLAAIKLNLSVLLSKLNSNSLAKELKAAKNLIDETILNVREIAKDLLPATLDRFGLCAALNELAVKISKPNVVDVIFSQNGNVIEFKKEKTLTIYRVVQELTNNALKHSQANKINIILNYERNRFILIIKDNGKGFSPDAVKNKIGLNNGMGLVNIESRLSTINGSIEYFSNQDIGTEARINLPLRQE